MGDFKKMHDDRYFAVGIGMLLVILIFYPLYEFLKSTSKKLIDSYLKYSKKTIKSRLFGLVLGFIVALIILFGIYAYLWYGINIIEDIKKALSG